MLSSCVSPPPPFCFEISVIWWCCADDNLQEEGGPTDEEMGGVGIHVRCIFEMDHPELLSTYLYTFAEQVALQDPENKARHMAEVCQEGKYYTAPSAESDFDFVEHYQNSCMLLMTDREREEYYNELNKNPPHACESTGRNRLPDA